MAKAGNAGIIWSHPMDMRPLDLFAENELHGE